MTGKQLNPSVVSPIKAKCKNLKQMGRVHAENLGEKGFE